ncbi:MAG: 3-oxosteroid 1-dehydrogenase [Gammaproteobacteria bacterium]|jgi:3-oxosteroid 1-dehydrogenase
MSKKRNDGEDSVSRRRFLGSVAAGVTLPSAIHQAASAATGISGWEAITDVVVVGSGAGALSAAVAASQLGDQVIVLEKSTVAGGTTAKSTGGIWTPNSHLLRAQGTVDKREDAIRYMVRLSFPEHYDPEHPQFGATVAGYAMIATFFDEVAPTVESLVNLGALNVTNIIGPRKVLMPDYFAHLPECLVTNGRIMFPMNEDGSFGGGAAMIRGLARVAAGAGVSIELGQTVDAAIQDATGRVVGVTVHGEDGITRRIGARKGVIFATGGFTHNVEMCRQFLKGPIYGGCAVASAEGDFVGIGSAAGARLGNMQNAWWVQIPLEESIAVRSVSTGIWCSPGDSMIQVNRFGRRFFDEKFVYNERTQAHFVWDAMSGTYPNLISILIYDARSAVEYAGFPPIPPAGDAPSNVLRADTLEGLAKIIDERFAALAEHTGALTLDRQFVANLRDSITRFNGFARSGNDQEFGRGSVPIDEYFHQYGPRAVANPMPNITMHPIADAGPYYAILMAPGALDTKGGPQTDPQARILDHAGQPIAGLYGAGNCVASPTGPGYWGGGATLGPALTFGRIAGRNAHTATPAEFDI